MTEASDDARHETPGAPRREAEAEPPATLSGAEAASAADALARFKLDLMQHVPALRRFARAFCRDAAAADDMAQEALLKAWTHRASFAEGTNMRGWLFTILRNAYYSDMRRKRREVEDADGKIAERFPVKATQQDNLELDDLRRAMSLLPAEQREALTLVSASGCSYEEAAEICNCAIGTMKSRVSRARRAVLALLDGTSHDTMPPRVARRRG